MRLYSLLASIMLLLLTITGASAQFGIYNGNFSLTQSAQASINGCSYITSHYLPNWIATHGTPDRTGTGAIHMWYDDRTGNPQAGEGIAGGYHFEPGMTYEISLEAAMPPPLSGPTSNGALYVYAATGLLDYIPNPNYCGDPVPAYMGAPTAGTYSGTNPNGVFCQKEQMGVAYMSPSSAAVYTFNYTPTMPNEQIWLYPYVNNGIRIEPEVKWVRIKACTNGSSITYTSAISPAGTTHYNTITAGGGPTSTVVNATPFQNTAYIGPNINLVPNFSAVFAGANDHYFLALAIPDCGDTTSPASFSRPSGSFAQSIPGYDDQVTIGSNGETLVSALSTNELSPTAGLYIVPNPVKDYMLLTFPKVEGNAEITVSNAAGRIVFHNTIPSSESKLTVNTSSFAKGAYYVRIIATNGVFVGKVTKL